MASDVTFCLAILYGFAPWNRVTLCSVVLWLLLRLRCCQAILMDGYRLTLGPEVPGSIPTLANWFSLRRVNQPALLCVNNSLEMLIESRPHHSLPPVSAGGRGPLICKNYLVVALGEETAAQAVIGFMVWCQGSSWLYRLVSRQ